MATLKSINEHLKAAAEQLDHAARGICDLPLEPTKEHLGAIGKALGNILEVQCKIYHLQPV
ncbi:MAG: hypothetical protein OEV42_16770 [Deltaproteobacteria bacterium]|nr:hypothetical protein [Deltaproteobacteria bacterium]